MRLELNLQPLTRHDQPLVFGWDSETGEVWGRDAERVRHMVRLVTVSDYVPGIPGNGGEESNDLLTNYSKFCNLLHSSHALPPLMMEAFSSPLDSEQGSSDVN